MRLWVLLFLIFKQHLAIVIEMFSTFSRDISAFSLCVVSNIIPHKRLYTGQTLKHLWIFAQSRLPIKIVSVNVLNNLLLLSFNGHIYKKQDL